MDANPQEGAVGLELLAITSPGEFVEAFLRAKGHDEYERNANGNASAAATLDNLCGGWRNSDRSTTFGDITVKCVESDGGGEGEGESVTRVFAVIKDGKEIAHFTVSGYYASEYGTDWDDLFYTVYPRLVVVTQYHNTKE